MLLRTYLSDGPHDRAGCLAVARSNVPRWLLASDEAVVADFLDRLDELDVTELVVEDGGRIVACGGVVVGATGEARLCWGMVDASRHRTGLGRLLLLARLGVAAARGAERASLETIPEAEGFFVHLGFTLTGGVDDHYAPGMHRRDLVLTLDAEVRADLRAHVEQVAHALGVDLAPDVRMRLA